MTSIISCFVGIMYKMVSHTNTASNPNIIFSTYFWNKTKGNKQLYIMKWLNKQLFWSQ